MAKYLITALTMLLSAFVYGFKMGIWFGVGLVLLIFVHEMGHVWAMKRKGYPTRPPIFIPLLGAVIFAPKMDKREDESYIGIGGPLIGSIGAIILWGLWYIIPSHPPMMLFLAFVGIYLNLFNLLPIRPLDGGRILQIVGPWYKWIGMSLLIIFVLIIRHPGMLVIVILCIDDFVPNIKKCFQFQFPVFIMMILGYIVGPGFVLEFWVDITIGGLFTLMSYAIYKSRESKGQSFVEERVDDREYPDKSIRNRWLFNYFLLLISLLVIIGIMLPQIKPMLESVKGGLIEECYYRQVVLYSLFFLI